LRRLIGLDPGLRRTGWGVIEADATRLSHVANGVIGSDAALGLTERLVQLHEALRHVLEAYRPEEAAVEASLVNRNPTSSLKLGVARGVVLLPAFPGSHQGVLQDRQLIGVVPHVVQEPDEQPLADLAASHRHRTGDRRAPLVAVQKRH